MDAAQAELRVVGARMAASYPNTHTHLKPRVTGYAKPLAEGGADAPSNMQWQTVQEAKAKDKIECGGKKCGSHGAKGSRPKRPSGSHHASHSHH